MFEWLMKRLASWRQPKEPSPQLPYGGHPVRWNADGTPDAAQDIALAVARQRENNPRRV